MSGQGRSRDRQRRRARMIELLRGEEPGAVLDAVGYLWGLEDGEFRAVFRAGHLTSVCPSWSYTREQLSQFDPK